MKTRTRMMLAALTVLAMSAGGFAYAARGDAACDGPGMMASGRGAGEYMGKRLERLHGELKLNADQETAWKAWIGRMQEKMAKMQERRPDFESMARLPAPERMTQMLERHKEHQKDMETGLIALRDFYGKLTPEQQKVFDRFHSFGGHPRGGMRHGTQGRPS